jgi:hypothetical protein
MSRPRRRRDRARLLIYVAPAPVDMRLGAERLGALATSGARRAYRIVIKIVEWPISSCTASIGALRITR